MSSISHCVLTEDLYSGTLSATLKFKVRDCDPATGEPDTDEGYEDDYTVSVSLENILSLPWNVSNEQLSRMHIFISKFHDVLSNLEIITSF